MIQKLLQRLRRWNRAEPRQAQPREPRFRLGDGFYFDFEQVSNGYGGHRMINVYLLREDDTAFRRCIVDEQGGIQRFPGFVQGKWKEKLEYPLDNKVQFDFWISPFKEGKAAVRWTLQPDGRYFEDEDGYGAEKCEEITLYSALDAKGNFVEPFRQE